MKTKMMSILLLMFFYISVEAVPTLKTGKKAKPKSAKVNLATLANLTKNLEYAFDKPAVKDAYYKQLDQLAKAVIDDNYAVSLKGHADAIGAYKYNWVLSDQRAINVKNYLISKGVKEDRIVTTPFGSTVPIATNKTSEGRQKNRRVEIALKKIS